MKKLENSRIAIIGLGYVGLPLAVEFGKHFETTGYDIRGARVAELREGRDSTLECSTEGKGQRIHWQRAEEGRRGGVREHSVSGLH